MRALNDPLILSVSGRDRPGILAELAAALAEAGIAVVDIEQATLQDFLALSFLLDLEDDPRKSHHLLGEVIPLAGSLGLAVDVRGVDAEQVRRLKDSDRYVLTLVSEGIDASLIAAVASAAARHRANIVSIRRLAEEDLRAGEYVLDAREVDDAATLRADLLGTAERLGVDAGLAREDVYRRNKRLVVFDMDSTLIAGEVIDMLAESAGVRAQVEAVTEEAMEGRLEFAESLRRRVALLKGLPEARLFELARALPLTPGAEEVLGALRRLGYRLAVVSGGFEQFTASLKERFRLDYAFGNVLEIRDGYLTGRVREPILDGKGKAERLEEIAAREGIGLDQVVGVGDGANDIPMLQAAGLGIAFRAKEATRRSADASIQRNDFGGLLYLLGVGARERRETRKG